MIDYLKDLIEHTHDLGCVNLVKITGTKDKTIVNGIAEDRSVIISAVFHKPNLEFDGIFGMPNMSTLKTILGIDEYETDSVISVARENHAPASINFKNATGDFTNSYRLMNEDQVEKEIPELPFLGASWDVQLEPSMASITRLRYQAAANSAENTFIMKTEDGNLVFYFGNQSTHAGNFVFATGVEGVLTHSWHWPIAHVINILNLPGDKVFQVSSDGATRIVVDSGIAEYTYILPGQSK